MSPTPCPVRPGIIATLALAACLALLPAPAPAADSCWIDGSTPVSFGTVRASGATVAAQVRFVCQNDGPAVRTFRVCLYLNPDQPTGIAPRRLVQWWPLDYLQYDVYADAALTELVGSTSSGHPVRSAVLTTSRTGQSSAVVPLYARIPAGQTVTAGNYVGFVNSILRTASQAGTAAPSTAACATGSEQSQHMPLSAAFADGCQISTATDMDFGVASALSTAREQTSTINLRCPSGTAWRVTLNNGSHASGQNRRMAGPGGYLGYQLYRDASRTQVWGGNNPNSMSGTGNNLTQSLTVYGRVPAQPVAAPGTYSDTVTITLTY